MKNNKCQAWIEIFSEIGEFMEAGLNKWNTIDQIRRTYDRFVRNLKKINDLQPELERDFSHIREELSRKRGFLMEKLLPPGSILDVYTRDRDAGKKASSLAGDWKKAESLGNHGLLELSNGIFKLMDKYLNRSVGEQSTAEGGSVEDVSPGTLHPENEAEKDESLPVVTGNDAGGNNALENDIRGYGLSRIMLDELQAAIREYRSALKLLDDVLKYRRKMRRKRDGLIRTNRKLLKNRLDKLMTVFSGTHPSFYREYGSLRAKKPGT